jgi:aminodeoxychorismate synthase component I
MEPLSRSYQVMPAVAASAPVAEHPAALLSGGSALFDGEGFGGVAGRDPKVILEGGWDDWEVLEEALSHGTGGGLAGWFDYDGNFRFGDFDRWTPAPPTPAAVPVPHPRPSFAPGLGREEWVRLADRAKQYIAAGDIYQVNLTHTLTAAWPDDPALFYPRLRAASPAPYACFVQLGDTTVLSASPECFLHIDGRHIVTRPIKGTRPRGVRDAEAARELLASEKERAELVMITDLERNDLGQVCEYGSVHVTALCELQTFAQVHHLVSTVEGRLRPEVSPVQAVRACYPGGSITGAPKKRAREIIAELESAPRGIYTGAVGFFGRDGRAVFNIAIRTLVVRDGSASYGVGAGLVADSEPAAEYAETLLKAAGLSAALS